VVMRSIIAKHYSKIIGLVIMIGKIDVPPKLPNR